MAHEWSLNGKVTCRRRKHASSPSLRTEFPRRLTAGAVGPRTDGPLLETFY